MTEVAEVIIETKTTPIHTPGFISRWPVIDQNGAADLAYQFNLVESWILKRYGGNIHSEGARSVAAKAGLRYCREHDVDLKTAFAKAEGWEKNKVSTMELFDSFLERPKENYSELAIKEGYRREKRDRDILQLEKDLLRKQGTPVPEFESLLEYCDWIAEGENANSKKRRWNWDISELDTSKDIYWDLMDHYSQLIENCRNSFDPSGDWYKYIKGELDITSFKVWHLQNLGDEDISYYSMTKRWGGGARTRPNRIKYFGSLLTHSTSMDAARDIVTRRSLRPRVNYSVDLIVSPGRNAVAFIFDREMLQKTYSLEPYTEPGGGHEREIRSYEENSINFAIGFLPVTEEIFFSKGRYSEGTTAMGRETMKLWSERYRRTGNLWSDEEIKTIKEIIKKEDASPPG